MTFWKRAVYRYTADGKADRQVALKGLASVADPAAGGAWVVTDEEYVRVDKAGAVQARVKLPKPARTAWLATD